MEEDLGWWGVGHGTKLDDAGQQKLERENS